MKLPIIRTIASNNNITEADLKSTVKVLEILGESRGLTDQDLDTIGEVISNLEGAKVVIDDHRHYGTPLREALNKFMKRVIQSVQ